GIGWALARLARSDAGSESDRKHWNELADAAFAFQDLLFDSSIGNWRDVRMQDTVNFPTWCNGGVGIGLALALAGAADEGQREQGGNQYAHRCRSGCGAARFAAACRC
ncbi:lanthionine synthetase LanC family protein, partial [Lysobacter sp. 2RAB21]